MQRQKILVIVGPTASGKSALGVRLAKKFGGEVVSADSRQVYRGLTIGTGKITKREMKGVPHHLLDVASPKRTFSAGDYTKLARNTIARMEALPIVVGGTGFYIDALLDRIALPDVPPNPVLRKRYNNYAIAELLYLLKKADPKRAQMMNTPSERNNKVRLIRALEIAAARGVKKSPERVSAYDILWIGIKPPFAVLEKNISKRLAARMQTGMIAEAQRLHKAGLSYKRMEALGLEYRSLARFLQKKISRAEMIAELQRDIRRYAKKQLMYWNRNGEIQWFDPKDVRKVESAVTKWLNTTPYASVARRR